MTQEQIVKDWLSVKSNRDKLPKIAYAKPIFEFIYTNCDVFTFPENDGFVVFFNNKYFKMYCKN
jgi:hypothetical protein